MEKKQRVRTGPELIQHLNSLLDRQESGEIDRASIDSQVKIIDSMCRVAKVTADINRDLLRYDGAQENLRSFAQGHPQIESKR